MSPENLISWSKIINTAIINFISLGFYPKIIPCLSLFLSRFFDKKSLKKEQFSIEAKTDIIRNQSVFKEYSNNGLLFIFIFLPEN